jgi:subtilisin family serine protease
MRAAGAALVFLALSLAGPAAAAPMLVQVRGGGAFDAQAAGGVPVSRALGIWRLDGHAAGPLLRRLRTARVPVRAEPERVLAAADISQQFSDPLVSTELWWLHAIGADTVEPPGPGIPLTIVDSGLDSSHPEFAGRPNLTLLNTQTTFGREENHGTEVSSVAAAPTNGVGVVGVYPQANLRIWDASPVRGITNTQAILGIERAAQDGAGVVNMSWGSDRRDSFIEQAILRGLRQGVLFVAASGNGREQGSPAEYPASLPHVLTVGASDEQNDVTVFSTASAGMDIVAPGQDIPVADPRADGGYGGGAGTSFSAPIVSGAAAWIWTQRPTLDNTQMFDLLRSSATDLGATGWDPDYGFGLLNLPAALSAVAPARDPKEPNDDVDQVKAGGIFPAASVPLTSTSRQRASIAARVDSAEDPRDVYRVYIPARKRVTFALRGQGLSVTVWRNSARSVLETGSARRADLRGAGTGSVTVVGGSRGEVGYASVQPESPLHMVSYSLTVSSR